MVSFSAHHLLVAFTHKSSVTVAELRDYITRRKNKKISIVKGGKNACTRSRIRIVMKGILIHDDFGLDNSYRVGKFTK